MKFIKVFCSKENSDIFINADQIVYFKDMRPYFNTTIIHTTEGNIAVSATIEEILNKLT